MIRTRFNRLQRDPQHHGFSETFAALNLWASGDEDEMNTCVFACVDYSITRMFGGQSMHQALLKNGGRP